MFYIHLRHAIWRGLFSLTGWLIVLPSEAAVPAQAAYPISRIARAFDSQLARTEKRILAIEGQMANLPEFREQALKADLGFQACRNHAAGSDPSVTLDLHRSLSLETIYLIPAQREFLEDSGIFPKRFTLEISDRADFSERTILFTSGEKIHDSPAGDPVAVVAGKSGRFVRLTVHEGHDRGMLDVFGLSEIIVIADHEPVSFQASVTSVGALEVPGIWSVAALTDGRIPLGIWQNGRRTDGSLGDSVALSKADECVTWTLRLNAAATLDRLVLFPYQIGQSSETCVTPDALNVTLSGDSKPENSVTYDWSNPQPGVSSPTPLIFPLKGQSASTISITAVRPHQLGQQKIAALSEIEVWSNGKNLAATEPIERNVAGVVTTIRSLTDGYTSQQKIIPIQYWLEQLNQRRNLARELAVLKPLAQQLSSESELNVTWGSAVLLGLSFLVPIFMVERRRLGTRNQLDQLRKRIASDLHDDIGSNLGSISLIARSARQDLERQHGASDVATDLGQVESIALESSLAMRDIVWLLERKQDSIGDLAQRMRETAGRLLREVSFTLECDTKKIATKLSLDAKRHLFLFYKEAIHNVLKHSRADHVAVRFWDENDQLALEISDNGIGIPRDHEANLLSIRKLEERAKILDGKLKIISSAQTGTQIRLRVRRSQLTAQPTLS